jgi:hypothetical protein
MKIRFLTMIEFLEKKGTLENEQNVENCSNHLIVQIFLYQNKSMFKKSILKINQIKISIRN